LHPSFFSSLDAIPADKAELSEAHRRNIDGLEDDFKRLGGDS